MYWCFRKHETCLWKIWCLLCMRYLFVVTPHVCIIEKGGKSAICSLREFRKFWKGEKLHYWIEYFPLRKLWTETETSLKQLKIKTARLCNLMKASLCHGRVSPKIVRDFLLQYRSTEKFTGALFYIWKSLVFLKSFRDAQLSVSKVSD